MEKFTVLEGVAAPLRVVNVDTDMIIPKQHLKTIKRTGIGKFLFDDAELGANATLTIDLPKQEIRGPDGGVVKFDIDPHRKHCLLNGLDDIGLTMVKSKEIDDFEAKAKAARPWA